MTAPRGRVRPLVGRMGLTGLTLAIAAVAAAPASAAYPGHNGALAFTSTQDGGARHIFLQTAAGPRDLTGAGSPADETQPKLSPDGREILFTRQAPGLHNSEIFVMSATGTGRTQLTNTAQPNSDATWSPDGTRIAFVSGRAHGEADIFVMNSDGTDVTEITHDASAKSELAWSPRGNRIAFVREPAGGGDRDIYSITPNGGGLLDLTNDPQSDDVEPAYSPDGDFIAYSGADHPNRESVAGDLWIMGADGSAIHPLTHESNGYSDGAYPAWSPDGGTIAFAANDGSGYYHVWSVPSAGGQNTELVQNPVAGGNPDDEEVDWGPASTAGRPRTEITGASLGSRHRATFRFHATGPATGYRCLLHSAGHAGRFAPCHSPRAYAGLKPGHYSFEVTAFGPGEHYRAPAVRRFRIR